MSNSRHPSIRSLSVKFSQGHKIPWHQHDWSQLIYASQGTMRVEADEVVFVVPTRRAIWVPAGFSHRIYMQSSVHLKTIYLDHEELLNGLEYCHVVNVSPLMHELLNEICRRSIVVPDTPENKTLIQFFNHQLDQMGSVPLSISIPVDDRARCFAIRLLEAPENEFGLERLAVEVGSSLRNIQRLFQAELGISVSQYRNKARMLRAIQLLSNEQSVTSTALKLGFENPSSFIYAFRKFFGQTPGQFQRNQGK